MVYCFHDKGINSCDEIFPQLFIAFFIKGTLFEIHLLQAEANFFLIFLFRVVCLLLVLFANLQITFSLKEEYYVLRVIYLPQQFHFLMLDLYSL